MIHPADAKARGIQDGDLVRAFNERGQILVGALLSYRWLHLAGLGAALFPPAGMLVGALTVIVWKQFGWLGLYEIIPGFVFATLAIVLFSLLDKAPSKAMLERFDDAEREFQTPPDALGQPATVN